ncbi:MAG: DUF6787 family protein [Prolixibacteraceae bacterium]
MLEKLKQRWEVKSNLQLIMILLVFSLSGSITVFAKAFIFSWINYSPEWPLYIKVLMYVVVVVPVYQLTLLTTGTLLGQFEFFWRFEKKTMRRLGIKFGK